MLQLFSKNLIVGWKKKFHKERKLLRLFSPKPKSNRVKFQQRPFSLGIHGEL